MYVWLRIVLPVWLRRTTRVAGIPAGRSSQVGASPRRRAGRLLALPVGRGPYAHQASIRSRSRWRSAFHCRSRWRCCVRDRGTASRRGGYRATGYRDRTAIRRDPVPHLRSRCTRAPCSRSVGNPASEGIDDASQLNALSEFRHSQTSTPAVALGLRLAIVEDCARHSREAIKHRSSARFRTRTRHDGRRRSRCLATGRILSMGWRCDSVHLGSPRCTTGARSLRYTS